MNKKLKFEFYKSSSNFKRMILTSLLIAVCIDVSKKIDPHMVAQTYLLFGVQQHALIPQVRTEKRDGSTTNNPYVAFRRRTEKMQTRKVCVLTNDIT